MTNNTDYPLKIKTDVENINKTYDEDKEFVLYFQHITREYIVKSDVRGILIYHGVGYGKSITSSAIADYYRKFEPHRKIIVLLPKSLQSNFEQNITKYMKNNPVNTKHEKSSEYIDETIQTRYNFISLNSSNMFTNLSKVRKSEHEIELDKKLGIFTENTKGILENSLLIVDEFHNLSNAITNGSKNAVKLYHLLMLTKNIKMIFLTGTPIINNPFELVPTFNLLKGYINFKNKITLFPENFNEFKYFFLNSSTAQSIKNKERFQNRIFGLVSYYGDYYFDKNNKKDFPQELPMIIEKVPMSVYQFSRYQEARDKERREESRKTKRANNSQFFSAKEDSKPTSSYRIGSRQACNGYIPDYALTTKSGHIVAKHISKIKEEDLRDLDKISPKFKKIMENINKHKNQIGYIYSEFVSGEGIALYARILDCNGYKYWEKSSRYLSSNDDQYKLEIPEDTEITDNDGVIEDIEVGGKEEKTYAIITGDIPFYERQHIVDIFNSKDNITGKFISLLLISRSGAEGISLKHVRHAHLEPFWNYARIEQIIARGVRFQSHSDLPKEDRNVQTYMYISVYPVGYKNPKKIKELTTDEELYTVSLNGKKLRSEFELALVEASIDCSFNVNKLSSSSDIAKSIHCYVCAPTHEQLYENDLYKEIQKNNPCKQPEKKEVTANEIKVNINGEELTFYYTMDKNNSNIQIFSFSNELNGYVPLKKSYPFYSDIVKKIINFD